MPAPTFTRARRGRGSRTRYPGYQFRRGDGAGLEKAAHLWRVKDWAGSGTIADLSDAGTSEMTVTGPTKAGGSLTFDGTDDFCTVPTFAVTAPFSVGVRFKLANPASTTPMVLFSKKRNLNSTTAGWAIYQQTNTINFRMSNGTSQLTASLALASTAAWHVAVGSAASPFISLALDTRQNLNVTVIAPGMTSTGTVDLGRVSTGSGFFPGQISDAFVTAKGLDGVQLGEFVSLLEDQS